MIEFTFASEEDGIVIQAYHWPVSGAKGVVQISHGAAEHARRYGRFAEALNAAGYEVYANDHRGHGKSLLPGKLGVFADADGWNRAVSDLAQFNNIICEHHPSLPKVLFGHSMGSLMAQQYLVEHGQSIQGLVLCGSFMLVGSEFILPLIEGEYAEKGRDAPCQIMAEAMGGGSFEWLSRDVDEVQKYIDDPLCGFELTVGVWLDLLKQGRVPVNLEALAPAPKQLPVYIIAGDQDTASNKTESLQQLLSLYQEGGLAKVSHRFYEGARHEILNETNRDEVTTDVITWMNNNLR